jgi:hypothetical protein
LGRIVQGDGVAAAAPKIKRSGGCRIALMAIG